MQALITGILAVEWKLAFLRNGNIHGYPFKCNSKTRTARQNAFSSDKKIEDCCGIYLEYPRNSDFPRPRKRNLHWSRQKERRLGSLFYWKISKGVGLFQTAKWWWLFNTPVICVFTCARNMVLDWEDWQIIFRSAYWGREHKMVQQKAIPTFSVVYRSKCLMLPWKFLGKHVINQRIIELPMLEKTLKITESNCNLTITNHNPN